MEWKAEDRRQVPLHGMFCDFNADWQTGGIMPEETVGQECVRVLVCVGVRERLVEGVILMPELVMDLALCNLAIENVCVSSLNRIHQRRCLHLNKY